jgi:hypothetical protein
MLTLLPSHQETLVVALRGDEVLARLFTAIDNRVTKEEARGQIFFNGGVTNDRFRISLRIWRPNNYVPVVNARIDPTSTGCLLFIDYALFPATKLFVIFWLLFILAASIVSGYHWKNIIYLMAGVGIAAVAWWFVWYNFRIQLKATREALLKILS